MTYAIILLLTVAVIGYGFYVLFPQAMKSTGRGAKRWAYLFGVTLLLEVLLFVISPVLGWWLPPAKSTYSWDVDLLFYVILAVTGVTFIAVSIVYTYILFKFPKDPERRSVYTHGNHTLELVWTAVPGVLLFLLAIGQIPAWAKVKLRDMTEDKVSEAMQVEVTARQWEWRVRYPGPAHVAEWRADDKAAMRDLRLRLAPRQDDVRLVNEVHAVKGQRLLIHLRTQDVLHSFFLPQMRLKQDAMPGRTILIWFEPTDANCERVGDEWKDGRRKDPKKGWVDDSTYIWELACTEYCGSRHSLMRGKLFVHDTQEDFDAWLKLASQRGSAKSEEPAK